MNDVHPCTKLQGAAPTPRWAFEHRKSYFVHLLNSNLSFQATRIKKKNKIIMGILLDTTKQVCKI